MEYDTREHISDEKCEGFEKTVGFFFFFIFSKQNQQVQWGSKAKQCMYLIKITAVSEASLIYIFNL